MLTIIIILLILVLLVNAIILYKIFKINVNKDANKFDMSFKLLENNNENTKNSIKDDIYRSKEETNNSLKINREELRSNLKVMSDSVFNQITNLTNLEKNQLDTFSNLLVSLTSLNEEKLNKMRETIEQKLQELQKDNNTKLEEMRKTVDEKLHSTLEKRLGDHFNSIGNRLELLYKQLGEMSSLSNGVNDLKRALTNVKTRGIWGEIQLGNLIDDILTKDQYETNVCTKKGSNDRVEYAIKLPGHDNLETRVYLPIDAKFPQEDYRRLLDAEEIGDKPAIDLARKQLEIRIKSEAKDIKDKYLDPPNTTDFGILFLPTESLFAEAIRSPNLIEILQKEYRVVIAGPTTLAAILNSLQMGFRTLAIEKRSSEVWNLLGAVKTEFGKFGDILEKTHKKLQEASNTIDTATRKTRTIERKLKTVQEIPTEESEILLDFKDEDTEEIEETI